MKIVGITLVVYKHWIDADSHHSLLIANYATTAEYNEALDRWEQFYQEAGCTVTYREIYS